MHEATHNLGPAHEYKYKGKTDSQWFGGGLASMMEELKAQTGALYFTDWITSRGLIDQQAATRAHLRDVTWAFSQISRGVCIRPVRSRDALPVSVGNGLSKGAPMARITSPERQRR